MIVSVASTSPVKAGKAVTDDVRFALPDSLGAIASCSAPASAGSSCMLAYRLHATLIVTPAFIARVATRNSVVGEHADSGLPWTARAMRDVRRADPFQHFLGESAWRFSRSISIWHFRCPTRSRASCYAPRCRRSRSSTRLAADSEHHRLARRADWTDRRIDHDSRGRLEKSLIRILVGGGVLGAPAVFICWCAARGVGLGDVWLLGMVGGFLVWPGFSSRCFSVR